MFIYNIAHKLYGVSSSHVIETNNNNLYSDLSFKTGCMVTSVI